MAPTFYTGIGQVDVLDCIQAAASAIGQCNSQLGGRRPGAALLFASVDLDHRAILEAILEAWPGVALIGCSSDGEFSSRAGYTQDSLLLVALASDTVEFTSGFVEGASAPDTDFRRALEEARSGARQAPAHGLVLTDGLTLNGEDALRAFHETMGDLPVWGGTAADGWRFTGTRQFHGGRVFTDAMVFLLLSGRFRASISVKEGWRAIGRVGVVTRVSGKVVHEIDHRPALTFYKELMGEAVAPSVEIPTAVFSAEGAYRFLRTSFEGTDTVTGAITFFASVPLGSRVQLTLATRDSIIGGARQSLEGALRTFGGGTSPDLALCISCAARRVILGSRARDEVRTAQSVLGEGVPVAGFYGFGEFSPSDDPGATQFNNESFVTLLLG